LNPQSQADIGQVLVSAKKRSLDYTVSTETRKKRIGPQHRPDLARADV